MRFRIIPTEKCYSCGQQNQIVYNKLETHTLFGLRRVLYCDSCHKNELDARGAGLARTNQSTSSVLGKLSKQQLQQLQVLLQIE